MWCTGAAGSCSGCRVSADLVIEAEVLRDPVISVHCGTWRTSIVPCWLNFVFKVPNERLTGCMCFARGIHL
jgi:hypothetical protein